MFVVLFVQLHRLERRWDFEHLDRFAEFAVQYRQAKLPLDKLDDDQSQILKESRNNLDAAGLHKVGYWELVQMLQELKAE
eukprot:CAMPEP_0116957868 /NCGR_PEP_ID=MMETSP0467-20121206/44263_1 /TAXON_ID=283647 /ORGANISM="Mesodinium pulex, Strain SPMC105" /LENGTH=79 /DNA_ID=CAMNT_0004644771 /DNA_START=400 /DNA_END=639 /DNA_ORIENTATION=+